MKTRFVFLVLLFAVALHAQEKKLELAVCNGPFALCAASTCKLTGHNYPGTIFPEVVCTCPVLPGPSIANLGGEMKGSCDRPKNGVWSLYSLAQRFPQEVNGKWRRDVPAGVHSCPAAKKDGTPNLYGQCFSYPCSNLHKENGIELADCHCPALKVVAPDRTFATQAGLCHDKACSEIPVGGPFQLPNGGCSP
jgi:hypothetical protein